MNSTRRIVVVAAACLALCATYTWRCREVSDLDTRTFVLPSGFAGTEIALTNRTPELVAVIFHGFQCNRVMMTQLARYLAHAGLRVFLLDYPGHGETSLRFDEAQVPRQSVEAFREMIERYHIAPEHTSVIGHSFGSAGVIALATAYPSIRSSVFIGPGYYGGATVKIPRNALVLTAEHDHSYIIEFAKQLVAAATNGAAVPDRPFGQRPFLRLWRSVSGASHIGMLFSPAMFGETRRWVLPDPTRGRDVPAEGRGAVESSALSAAAALLLLVAIVIVVPLHPTDTAAGPRSADVLLLFLTTPTATVMSLLFNPLRPLRIIEGSAIVSTLVISGIMSAAIVVARGRRRPLPDIRLTDVGIAGGYFALSYVLLNFTVSKDYYDLSFKLIPVRLYAFFVFALCSSIFFLVVGAMLTRLHAGFAARSARIAVMVVTILCLSLFLPLSLWLLGPLTLRFYGPMVMLLLFVLGIAGILLELYRNSVVASMFGGLVVGWIMSVAFAFQ